MRGCLLSQEGMPLFITNGNSQAAAPVHRGRLQLENSGNRMFSVILLDPAKVTDGAINPGK